MKYTALSCFLVFILFLGSCSSFSFSSSENSAWAVPTNEKPRGTVRISSVSAEKSGEWGSLEKEITDLLPLLFSEESYLVVSPGERADFTAKVEVREREYLSGWQTKRSLSVELRLWAAGADGPLPLSAGRALVQGRQSLASSQTLDNMLRKAVKNAVRGLPEGNRK